MGAAGWWLVTGSGVFLVGAAVAVPRVFTEPDPQVRLAMLQERRAAWQAGQPLYALGPLLVGLGVAVAAHDAGGTGALLLAVSAGLLLAGALAWTVDVALRARRIEDFVLGRLPAWPFPVYVVATCAGLGLLGAGLLREGVTAYLGWAVLVLSGVFLVAFLVARDIPPFVFYVLTLAVGLVLVLR